MLGENFDTGDEEQHYDSFSEEDIASEKEQMVKSREVYSRISIDTWKTKLHDAVIGIRQQDRYQAKSRQFSLTMDVIGEVTFYSGFNEEKPIKDLEYSEIIAIDSKYWDTNKKSVIYKEAVARHKEHDPDKYSKVMKKLILKTFVGLADEKGKGKSKTAGKWTGTMEESQILSLALTFGEKDPLPFFYIDIPGFKFRIPVFRTHAVTGERYVFMLFGQDEGVVPYYIEGKRLTPGSDYTVFDARSMKRVAFIDDRRVNIGGKVDINFFEGNEYDSLNRNRVFRRILILFAVSVKFLHDTYSTYKTLHRGMTELRDYNKDMEKAIKKSGDTQKIKEKYEDAKKKMKFIENWTVWPKELSLHFNPRRVRT